MSLIVKICGISSEEALDAALEGGADMVGLVFFPASPRYIGLERAASLAGRARGRAEVAALTVDMDDVALAAIVETVRPDWLQLHGKESAERVAEVRRRFTRRVMKAVGVRGAADVHNSEPYRAVADLLLLDAKPPKGADRPGGNGATFDWTVLERSEVGMPYLLSGGLDAANVATALRITHAPGVDVSSGVETAPGRKDPDLILNFIAAARRAAAYPAEAVS